MNKKPDQQWEIGSIFVVPQSDGGWSAGQTLDLMMPNVVSCAFYDIRLDPEEWGTKIDLSSEKLIATLSVSRHHLDLWAWKVIGKNKVALARRQWPNEQYRKNGWIGAVHHTGAIIEDFLNAFYGFAPWDMYLDPEYFDKLLVSPVKKPKHLLFKSGERT